VMMVGSRMTPLVRHESIGRLELSKVASNLFALTKLVALKFDKATNVTETVKVRIYEAGSDFDITWTST
jgi:hypothetical protein